MVCRSTLRVRPGVRPGFNSCLGSSAGDVRWRALLDALLGPGRYELWIGSGLARLTLGSKSSVLLGEEPPGSGPAVFEGADDLVIAEAESICK